MEIDYTVDYERDLKDVEEIEISDLLKEDFEIYPHQLASMLKIQEKEDWMINPMKYIKDFDEEDKCIRSNFLVFSDPVGTGKTLTILLRILNEPYLTIPKVKKSKCLVPMMNIKSNNTTNYFITEKEINKTIPRYLDFDFKDEGLKNYGSIINVGEYENVKVLKSNLIVVPHSVLKQWENAIKKFTKLSSKDFIVINRKSLIPKNIMDLDNKIITLVSFNQYYDFFKELVETSFRLKTVFIFSRQIIDEAHMMVPKSFLNVNLNDRLRRLTGKFCFKAIFNWLVSSSYSELFYNSFCSYVFELNILRDVYNCIPDILIMNNLEKIYKSIGLPEIRHHELNCKMIPLIKLVYDNKISRWNNIPKEYFYADNINLIKQRLHYSDKDYELRKYVMISIENMIEYLRYSLTHLDHLNPYQARIKRQEYNEKLETLTNISSKINELPDTFEIKKIKDKSELKGEVYENMEMDKRFKLLRLFQYLEYSKPDYRALIFTEKTETFEYVINFLDNYRINYSEVKGTAAHINNVLKKFKNNEIKILLLNSRNMGAGMNIQAATDIILYHNMSKEQRNQVIGRAYRMGRELPLDVWSLYYEDEKPLYIKEIEREETESDSELESEIDEDIETDAMDPYELEMALEILS